MVRKILFRFRILFYGILSLLIFFGGCTKSKDIYIKKQFKLNEGDEGLAPLYSSNKNRIGLISAHYIVVLEDNIDLEDVDFESKKITQFLSSQKDQTFKYALKGFSIQLDAKDLKKVREDPNVKYVEQDQVLKISGTQYTPPWGLDRIDQVSLPLSSSFTYESTGSTVDAYIFDTGIKFDHNEFKGRVKNGFNAIAPDSIPEDDNGHGTHVAGIVGGSRYGVAKEINIIPVKVLDNFGTGSFSQIIAGLEWAIANHTTRPAVGNVSISGETSVSLDEAVRKAIADGIIISIAAGNNAEPSRNASPGRVFEAITVGAFTNTDEWSAFSNFGPEVDILAPGSSITSAWHTGINDINVVSGTSMATPHVTGAAALYIEKYPNSSQNDVQNGLKKFATLNKVKNVPDSTINLVLQVNFNPPTPSEPVLTTPSTGSINQLRTLTLLWNSAESAMSYDFQISDKADFSTTLLSLTGLTQTRQAVSGLGYGKVYYWRVRANGESASSNWSSAFSFTTELNVVGIPVLSEPSTGSINQLRTLTLVWNSSESAMSYDFQISDKADFSTTLLSLTGLTQTRQAVSGLGYGKVYYWRVRANGESVSSNWSAAFSFTTELITYKKPQYIILSPDPIFPRNQQVVESKKLPLISWTEVQGADSYHIQISESILFDKIVFEKSDIYTTTVDFSKLVQSEKIYYWRVKALLANSNSQWSTAIRFTTAR